MRANISSISCPMITSQVYNICHNNQEQKFKLVISILFMDTDKRMEKQLHGQTLKMPANQREYSANFNISKTFNKDVKKAEDKRMNFNQFSFQPSEDLQYVPNSNNYQIDLKYQHKQKQAVRNITSNYHQMQILQRQNISLRSTNKHFQTENIRLKNRNKYLQELLGELIRDIKQEHATSQINQNLSIIDEGVLSKSLNNKISTTNIHFNDLKLEKIIQTLQQQNSLLIQYKNACVKKLKQYSTWIEQLKQELKKQRQKSSSKAQKMQQIYNMYNESKQKIKQLQEIVQYSNEEARKVLRETKAKDEQYVYAHEKFHREMSKMKQKVQRYKQKSQVYRKQRDDLAIQIQKAKLEIGTVTLRKYFPEDSDD